MHACSENKEAVDVGLTENNLDSLTAVVSNRPAFLEYRILFNLFYNVLCVFPEVFSLDFKKADSLNGLYILVLAVFILMLADGVLNFKTTYKYFFIRKGKRNE